MSHHNSKTHPETEKAEAVVNHENDKSKKGNLWILTINTLLKQYLTCECLCQNNVKSLKAWRSSTNDKHNHNKKQENDLLLESRRDFILSNLKVTENKRESTISMSLRGSLRQSEDPAIDVPTIDKPTHETTTNVIAMRQMEVMDDHHWGEKISFKFFDSPISETDQTATCMDVAACSNTANILTTIDDDTFEPCYLSLKKLSTGLSSIFGRDALRILITGSSSPHHCLSLPTEQRCSLCHYKFEDGEDLYGSYNPKCRHVFHKECILEWLLPEEGRDLCCPNCRVEFFVESHRSGPKKTKMRKSVKSVTAIDEICTEVEEEEGMEYRRESMSFNPEDVRLSIRGRVSQRRGSMIDVGI